MVRAHDVPGVILAGGKSRRMGTDKAWVLLAGRPLISHVADALAPQCAALAVSGNADPGQFRAIGLPVLPDGPVEGVGPLAGILAAMDWAAASHASHVVTVAVDTPFLPADLVERLRDADAPISLAETADGIHGTTGIWSVDLRAPLREAIEKGLRKVTDWTAAQGAIPVRFPETHPPSFFNVNAPDDLGRAERMFSGRPARGAGSTREFDLNARPTPLFDSVLMVDWSGGNDTGPSPRRDAIWTALNVDGHAERGRYHRNRAVAETYLHETLDRCMSEGRRICVGFDFPFGFPTGSARAICGSDDPFVLWAWIEQRIEDAPKANNRFDLAGEINRRFAQPGPFWSNGLKRDIPGLPRKKTGIRYGSGFLRERRRAEELANGAFAVWQLAGAGAVGSQVLMGLPVLHRLRQRYGKQIAVSPFETPDAPIVLVEIWPSLFLGREPEGELRDRWQVEQVARAFASLDPALFETILREGDPTEGWIAGLGHEADLRAALG